MLHRLQLVGVPLAPRSPYPAARPQVHACHRRRTLRLRRRRLHAALRARSQRLRRR